VTATLPDAEAEVYRGELLGYCYRYFGCYAEAADAVQETMVRAWQHADEFAGRSSLRTWLYRIATNICLDMKRAPQRRSLPADLTSPGRVPDDPRSLTTRPEATWIGPISDDHLGLSGSAADLGDPADTVALRDSVRLAFITALQVLPPRQRVVLILRDVLSWSAQECADLLDLSVASVNSALARARRTLAAHDPDALRSDPAAVDRDAAATKERELLAAYVAAFEAYDVDRLVRLLADDAAFSMPPYELWLHGSREIERWWRGPGQICRNSRTISTGANGQPAVAVYHDLGDGRWEPFALHVLDIRDGEIAAITHFMGPQAFTEFGPPPAVVEAHAR
jgi:RNA polymerase sigma-70 factor (ECF subfamily)